MRRLSTAIAVLMVLLACHSVPIANRTPIAVPAGLNANDVEVAVLYELVNLNVPQNLKPGERIADSALKALFLFRYERASDRRPGWYPESAQQGVIYAGYEKRTHYLRVAIEYSDSNVSVRLIESRNLDQTETHIHEAAMIWIDQLEMRIRRALGQMAATRALRGREPI